MSTPSGQVGQDDIQTHELLVYADPCLYVQLCTVLAVPTRLHHTIRESMDLGRPGQGDASATTSATVCCQ